MNFKNKRLISTVIVVVLVVFSLIKGTITSSNSNKKDESELNGYLTEFLQEQSITKLTLKKGDSSQVIQKISIEGEINAEMTNTYSRGSVLNQIKEAKGNPNVKAILLSVNSPGGGVYETAELYNALKNSGKDVYVSKEDLIYPIFIEEGENIKNEIPSMPGIFRYSIDRLSEELDELVKLGINSILLFGIPKNKDACATEAYNENGIIQNAVRFIKEKYDYIIIDCPPSLGLITLNSLTAADGVIIPVQTEYYALEGLSQLMNTFNIVRKHLNSRLDIFGVLLTMILIPRKNQELSKKYL